MTTEELALFVSVAKQPGALNQDELDSTRKYLESLDSIPPELECLGIDRLTEVVTFGSFIRDVRLYQAQNNISGLIVQKCEINTPLGIVGVLYHLPHPDLALLDEDIQTLLSERTKVVDCFFEAADHLHYDVFTHIEESNVEVKPDAVWRSALESRSAAISFGSFEVVNGEVVRVDETSPHQILLILTMGDPREFDPKRIYFVADSLETAKKYVD